MNTGSEPPGVEVIAGSRWKAASLALVSPALFLIPDIDVGDVDVTGLAGAAVSLFGLLSFIMPGTLTLDGQGVEWKNLVGSRRLSWDQIAFAGVGANWRLRQQVYFGLTAKEGARGREKVWLPGFWTLDRNALAERIEAARERARPSLTGRYAAMMDEGRFEPQSQASPAPQPAAPVAHAPADWSPAAWAAPLSPEAQAAAAPVFGRRQG